MPEAPPRSAKGDSQSLAKLIEQWNSIPEVIHCRRETDKRRKVFRSRLTDPDWIASLDDALKTVRASAFLRGHNDRGWRADIDWFLRPDSLTKVLEGKYGNGAPIEQPSQHRELVPVVEIARHK